MNSKLNTSSATTLLQTAPAPASAPEELLTQAQLAARLGICRRTLSNWVRDKSVPMIKLRGYCRFEFSKVLAALQRHERGAVVPGAAAASSPESTRVISR